MGEGYLWVILAGYGIGLYLIAPRAADAESFFGGRDATGRRAGFWLLTSSVFISWIFAKSVTNAANLGAEFGVVGAVGYAGYWLSIPVAGLVIVYLRRRHGAEGLPSFLSQRFGRAAALAFLVAILIRLYNEVWSNTAVVASYFGVKGEAPYYLAAAGFTLFTLAYSLKGGLRSSILTDAVQTVLFVFLIGLVLFVVVPASGPTRLLTAGEFRLRAGLDLLLVGVIQSFSYPFHDPVLTDRAFISEERTTLRAFGVAGALGFLFIVLFGLVGVHAFVQGIPSGEDTPGVVARSFGVATLAGMNVLMLTSAGSTLDSTFSSLAKAGSLDLGRALRRLDPGRAVRKLGSLPLPAPSGPDSEPAAAAVSVGRWTMVVMAVLGNLPLLTGAKILQATTISGTMVMGLAPIFLLAFLRDAPPLSFHLAFWTGLALGVVHVLGWVPASLAIGDGVYASLLGVNVYGLVLCSLLFLVPAFLARRARTVEAV